MPIVVSMENDFAPIVIAKFVGNWTWSDYEQSIDEVVSVVGELNNFYQVLDFSETHWIPRGVPHRHIERARRAGSAILGVHIGNPYYLRLLYKTLSQPFDESAMHIVADMQAARQRIREHRAQEIPESDE